jgi:hypothetical protein
MERETGLEPATSSLGRYTSFESKSLVRFCCELLNLQPFAKSAYSKSVGPNKAQSRQIQLTAVLHAFRAEAPIRQGPHRLKYAIQRFEPTAQPGVGEGEIPSYQFSGG